MVQRLIDTEHFRLGAPLAWATAAAAILSLFAVVTIIVNYAPLNKAAEHRVKTQLPPATYETVAALIKATGNECARICAISPVATLSPSHAVDVECAGENGAGSCRMPIHYRLNVEPNDGPKR